MEDLVAVDLSDDITFDKIPESEVNPGIRVFDANQKSFFLPNYPILLDVVLFRRSSDEVFRIKTAPTR